MKVVETRRDGIVLYGVFDGRVFLRANAQQTINDRMIDWGQILLRKGLKGSLMREY